VWKLKVSHLLGLGGVHTGGGFTSIGTAGYLYGTFRKLLSLISLSLLPIERRKVCNLYAAGPIPVQNNNAPPITPITRNKEYTVQSRRPIIQ
jgi:hypothetical protein